MHKTHRRDFTGLKKHSHTQRLRILKKLVIPALRRELGTNMIAVAVDGSVARHEDTAYSDLELMIFVKNKRRLPHGFSRVHDGLLIEGLFITEKDYYKMILEPNPQWYLAGSDILLPVLNKKFLKKLTDYRVRNKNKKCESLARGSLHEVQEAFGKLFTAIDKKNRENLFVILSDVVLSVLKMLSFINGKPYTSSGRFITEAKKFKKKPAGFDEFIKLVSTARYHDWRDLEKHAIKLFKGIEDYFRVKYEDAMYDSDLRIIYRKKRNKKRR
ncbi:MAG: hypothetical protein JSV98_00300 [candidate division WOR-3 bacterium]|nr:MAG: hypothetical protein JSV98_00300 [candidate division WOR-3 bacterium]